METIRLTNDYDFALAAAGSLDPSKARAETIPLEEMDFVVDPKSRVLRPNPASPDAPLLDLRQAAL